MIKIVISKCIKVTKSSANGNNEIILIVILEQFCCLDIFILTESTTTGIFKV
jgi:hypothetical protein